MMQLVMIAGGGAIGAVMRHLVANGVYGMLGRGFPYGTLAVNVIGSLLMGMLYVMLVERVAFSVEWRAFLMIGVLGAFTTFSTFSIETLLLLETGAYLKAASNMILSVLLCILATWAGVVGFRQLFGG